MQNRTFDHGNNIENSGKQILNVIIENKWIWWQKLFPELYENQFLAFTSKKQFQKIWAMNGVKIIRKHKEAFFGVEDDDDDII